jgi:bla regulator protein blaR1
MKVKKGTTMRMIVLLAVLALSGAAMIASAQEIVPTAIAMARATKKVPPEFPAAARQLNITGASEVEVHVNESGDVVEVKILKGNAIFSANSMAAARQWKFTPMNKDGAAQKFTTVLVFNFAK